jgi:hypothetical protein
MERREPRMRGWTLLVVLTGGWLLLSSLWISFRAFTVVFYAAVMAEFDNQPVNWGAVGLFFLGLLGFCIISVWVSLSLLAYRRVTRRNRWLLVLAGLGNLAIGSYVIWRMATSPADAGSAFASDLLLAAIAFLLCLAVLLSSVGTPPEADPAAQRMHAVVPSEQIRRLREEWWRLPYPIAEYPPGSEQGEVDGVDLALLDGDLDAHFEAYLSGGRSGVLLSPEQVNEIIADLERVVPQLHGNQARVYFGAGLDLLRKIKSEMLE